MLGRPLLVNHFLRSDGPFGSAPLQSLDATPIELANATSLDGLDPEDAKKCFLGSFAPTNVTRYVCAVRSYRGPFRLRSRAISLSRPKCLGADPFAAGNIDDEIFENASANFSASMVPFRMSGVLPVLWQRLSSWCDSRRAEAQPYRRIVLPDPGHMTLIGYSVRLAFPSWRDRDRLTRDVEKIGPARLEGPRDVIATSSIHSTMVPIPLR